MIWLSVALAVCAAAANAAASVLQRITDRREPVDRAFSLAMMWDLARQWLWWGGILAMITGFLLQASALSTGGIAVVQPLLVFELPFTLILASLVFHSRLHIRERTAIVAMTGGLALFLYALSPSPGDSSRTSTLAWVLGIVATLILIGVLTVMGGRLSEGTRRGVLLGLATGVAFGLTAALIVGMAAGYAAGGIVGVFTTWQTYLVIVIGPLSFFLLQNTLQAGSLFVTQPALTLSDPVIAIIWGVVIFHEQVRSGLWLIGALAGAVLVGAGTVLMSHSPLLHSVAQPQQTAQREQRERARDVDRVALWPAPLPCP